MVVESHHLHLGTLTQPPHCASGGCVQSGTDTSICLDGCWRVRGEDLQNRSGHVVLTRGFESIIAIPMYFRITGVAFCHLLSSLGSMSGLGCLFHPDAPGLAQSRQSMRTWWLDPWASVCR